MAENNPLLEAIKPVIDFEQSTWANGSVSQDSFYSVPNEPNLGTSPPGTLLKVERDTDTTKYTIPPATSLSRIMYQSKRLNGSLVPVSAYVLWPYMPRSQPDGYRVVAFAHGTSGIAADSAPSHVKNLWHHFLAPYQLVLQGYVVVATDYSGLGVGVDAMGKQIIHEYTASPSHANDVVYSVLAARAAFPELSKQFVTLGHSQGGGAAWAVAQRQALEPVDGYLGTVAVVPVTRVLSSEGPILDSIVTGLSGGIASNFSDFKQSEILTEEGEERYKLILQAGGCTATTLALLSGAKLLRSGWEQNPSIRKYQDLIVTGGKKISGPLLVIQGESDPIVGAELTTKAVDKTAELFPESQLTYIRLPGVSHVPSLLASQRMWMDWIGDRFAGRLVEPGCHRSVASPPRPVASYQPELNWFVKAASEAYEMGGL